MRFTFLCFVVELSNWMRFVRAAEDLEEQNLVVSQEGDQLFYTTTRPIEPRQELKVWYSSSYARDRGLIILEYSGDISAAHHMATGMGNQLSSNSNMPSAPEQYGERMVEMENISYSNGKKGLGNAGQKKTLIKKIRILLPQKTIWRKFPKRKEFEEWSSDATT